MLIISRSCLCANHVIAALWPFSLTALGRSYRTCDPGFGLDILRLCELWSRGSVPRFVFIFSFMDAYLAAINPVRDLVNRCKSSNIGHREARVVSLNPPIPLSQWPWGLRPADMDIDKDMAPSLTSTQRKNNRHDTPLIYNVWRWEQPPLTFSFHGLLHFSLMTFNGVSYLERTSVS